MRSTLTFAATFAAGLLLVSCGGATGTDRHNTIAAACGENIVDPNCHTMQFGGVTRAYLLHVPANLSRPTRGASM